jgi:hypothetical protein
MVAFVPLILKLQVDITIANNLIEFRTVTAFYGFNHSIVTKSIGNYNSGNVLQIRTNYISSTGIEVWVKLDAVNATQPGTITFEASDTLLVDTPIVEVEPTWDSRSVYIDPKFQIGSVPVHITCPIIAPKIMAGNSAGLALYEDGGQGIFIKDGGDVGIGTTTPDFKLQVKTPVLSSGSTYAWPFDLTRINNTSRGFSIGMGSDNNVVLGSHNSDMAFGHTYGTDANDQPLFFETMRIQHIDQAVGNVGIGTTTPAQKLDVVGNIALTGTVDGVDIAAFKTAYDSHTHTFASLTSKPTTLAGFGITDAYTQTQVNSQISAATAALVDSSPATLDTLNELAAALGDDPNFATTTATSIGLKAPLASPSFTGNVGIGTTSPTTTLEVIGDIKIKQNSTFANYSLIDATEALLTLSTFSVNSSTYPADIKFSPNQTERMRITSSGNVGIGTTAPGGLLALSGSVSDTALLGATAGATSNALFNLAPSSDNIVRYGLRLSATGNDLNLDYRKSTDGSPNTAMTIQRSSGNVGIGTTSPANKLTVSGDIGYTGVIGQGSIYGTPANASFATMQLYNSANGFSIFNNQSYGYNFNTGGTTRVAISNAGNVGIGTTNPLAKLHVESGINSDVIRLTNTNAEAQIRFVHNAGTSYTATLGSQTLGANNVGLVFRTGTGGGSNRMTIDVNGNVGIGTTTPESKLHIAGVNGEAFRWSNSSTVYGKLSCGTAGARIDVTGANSGYGLSFSMDDSTKMIILPSGNVGIGTATPAQKLDVVGSIAISENIELGDASDTTITRVSAGKIAVEGVNVVTTSSTDTLTFKTLDGPAIENYAVFTGSTSGSTKLAATAVAGTTQLTLPAATDTLVGRNTADTLTNKTLTAPRISSIVNTGTLTLPTSTDTLVGRNTIDTLTNKTLTAPTITGAGAIAGVFTGNLTGNVIGNATTSSSTTGNAATATKLTSARTIGGVSFDGSANIPQRQVTHHSATFTFAVNTKQYIGLLDSDSESTAASNINLPFLAPFSGKLLKIFVRSSNNLTGGNLTLLLEKNALDVNAGGTPTVVTTNPDEQLGPSNSTMTTYEWITGTHSNTITAGDMIFISIASDTVFSSVKIFFTCLWEWDH